MKIKIINFNEINPTEDLILKNPEGFKKKSKDKKEKEFFDDGIFSPKIFGDMSMGNNYEKIDSFGWITFDDNYIINPLFYYFVDKCFNFKLEKIIGKEKKIDKDGNIVDVDEDGDIGSIGLKKFKDNFLNLLDKYCKPKNFEEKGFLIKNIDKIFINKLPVFSVNLRPALFFNQTVIYDDINNIYDFLIKYSNEIKEFNEEDEIVKSNLLFKLQTYALFIFENIIKKVKGKEGFFRQNMLGTRINFSARNVIVPSKSGEVEFVNMPYKVFGELYKFQLINIISNAKGISLNAALEYWNEKMLYFDEEFYSYMKLFNESNNYLPILLNRNPTINKGSILYLKIKEIKRDYNDMTLSISNSILSSLSGDYDGDTLNIIALATTNLKKLQKISPANLIIDNNNGEFNKDFLLGKDCKLGIFLLNNE